jgi:trk system potassium uptake protein
LFCNPTDGFDGTLMKKPKLQPAQVIVTSFLVAIVLGTLLLSLPVSVASGEKISLVDSLFTATSAVCVTGLTVQDTGSFFSLFGRLVIMLLIQVGGLGIMTFSTMFAILLGRRLSLSQNITIKSALSQTKIEGLTKLVLHIILFTLSIEAIGAMLLYARWLHVFDWGYLVTLERAVFHSVSAFCNAGFAVFSTSLKAFSKDWPTVSVFASLIVIGGIGFMCFLDIPKLKFWRKDRRLIWSRVSLQTKIVLVVTLALIVLGALGVYVFENNFALRTLPAGEKISASMFTSITARTAGFNILDTANLRPVTLFMLIMLMFIGASPGSTGGGIKTVTFGILIASFYSMFRNRDRTVIFKRTIPKDTYRRAGVIVFLALGVVILSTFLLSATESAPAHSSHFFLGILFESVSAFGTVGLSTGITPDLTALGKIIVIFTMFIGRVGPLTLALAIAMRNEQIDYRYPEEKLMVG